MIPKKIFSILLAVVSGLACSRYCISDAAEPVCSLERLEGRINSSEISFSYTYKAAKDNVSMTGQGTVILQGEAFILDVNGLEIYCDGSTRWTLDSGAEELVIESYDSYSEDLSANPAMLLRRLTGFFETVSQSDAEYGGEKAIRVELKPKSYPQFRSVTLYFRQGHPDSDILIGASIVAADGTVTDFTVTDFRYGPKGDPSRFSFDPSALAGSWIVTDLR